MIIELRQYIKSQTFKVLLWIVLILVVISGYLFRTDQTVRSALFSINGLSISRDQFEQQRYQQAERIQQLKQRFGPLMSQMPVADPGKLAFQSLVEEAVLNQVADAMELSLSPAYVATQLHGLDIEKLKQFLQFSGQTLASFEYQMEQALQRSMINNIIQLSTVLTDQEIKDAFTQEYIGKQYAYLTFPFLDALKQQETKTVSDETLKSFFDRENKRSKRYWEPEKRSGIMYEFSPETYNLSIAQSDIKNYYNTYRSKKFVNQPGQIQIRRILFTLPDQATEEQVKEIEEKAHKVHDELMTNPSGFARLAKEHSDDKKSAPDGGLLPFFKRGDRDPSLEKAAFRLKSDEAISGVIVTNEGFEILQRVSKKPIVYKPLDEVKDEIVTQLRKQKFKFRFAENINRLIAKKDKKGIAALIEQKKAQKQELPLTTKEISKAGDKLFKVRKDGWTYFMDNDKGYVVHVTEVQKSIEPAFESVKKQVLEDYSAKQAKRALNKELDNATKQAQDVSLDEIAKELNISVKKTAYLKRDDYEKLNELFEAGIPVGQMLSIHHPGATVAAYDKDGNGYLFKVAAQEPFDQKLFDEKKSELIAALQDEKGEIAERAFVASLARNATIKSKDPQFNIEG